MTYLGFLLIYIVPLVVLGGATFIRTQDALKSHFSRGLFLLAVMALLYTTLWDNYLVKSGVWSYPDERVLARIGYVPLEEYCFFVLQTYLTGFWCFFVQTKLGYGAGKQPSKIGYRLGLGFFTLVFLVGIACWTQESSRYLSLILVWAVPVVTLQWIVGGEELLRNMRLYAVALLPPTFYLWAVDALAISSGVWSISATQTLGLKWGALPFEEAVFFLMTNMMLVQGLILFVTMRKKYPQIYAKLKLRLVS